jgi:hypothetical protein
VALDRRSPPFANGAKDGHPQVDLTGGVRTGSLLTGLKARAYAEKIQKSLTARRWG